jgi:transposase
MSKPLVSDAMWGLVKPLFPKHEMLPKDGRSRLDDGKALTGILFVLQTGISWKVLPQEIDCGCRMIYWRWLDEWQAAGVWAELHRLTLFSPSCIKPIAAISRGPFSIRPM